MKQVKIQVAAPEGGMRFDIGSEPTPFARWSNEFKKLGQPVQVIANNGKQVSVSRHRTHRADR